MTAPLLWATFVQMMREKKPTEVEIPANAMFISEQNFAEALERQLQNMERINDGNGGIFAAKAVPQVEAKPPRPHINDRRFRRI
jgi:hypothetical protein